MYWSSRAYDTLFCAEGDPSLYGAFTELEDAIRSNEGAVGHTLEAMRRKDRSLSDMYRRAADLLDERLLLLVLSEKFGDTSRVSLAPIDGTACLAMLVHRPGVPEGEDDPDGHSVLFAARLNEDGSLDC